MDHGALQTKPAYCTLVNKSDNSKYVCYSHTKAGSFNIGLTNASEVWSKDFTEDMLAEHGKNVALKSAEDYISKIRSTCGNGSASVTVQEDGAVLQLGVSPGSVSVTLPRLSDLEGREELRDLLFRMADSLKLAETTGGPSSFSPGKSQFRRNAGFEPRSQQTGPTVVAKKRLPGDSLINPGSRKKKPATGVAFDDNNDL
ncbi:protein PAXX [Conger conger]|uniref:protein PAXX n=1 Tax=Conger conger TaxID=82655 RepID=UPI002A59BFBE|nr:protein PAXX [Conger conger]